MRRGGATRVLAILQNEFSIFQQFNLCRKSEIFWKKASVSFFDAFVSQEATPVSWLVPLTDFHSVGVSCYSAHRKADQKETLPDISTTKLSWAWINWSLYWPAQCHICFWEVFSQIESYLILNCLTSSRYPSYPLLSIHIWQSAPFPCNSFHPLHNSWLWRFHCVQLGHDDDDNN